MDYVRQENSIRLLEEDAAREHRGATRDGERDGGRIASREPYAAADAGTEASSLHGVRQRRGSPEGDDDQRDERTPPGEHTRMRRPRIERRAAGSLCCDQAGKLDMQIGDSPERDGRHHGFERRKGD